MARRLGAPVIEPPGNNALDQIPFSARGVEYAFDTRDPVPYPAKSSNTHELWYAYTVGQGYASEIVANEIHDHHMFQPAPWESMANCGLCAELGYVPLMGKLRASLPLGLKMKKGLHGIGKYSFRTQMDVGTVGYGVEGMQSMKRGRRT